MDIFMKLGTSVFTLELYAVSFCVPNGNDNNSSMYIKLHKKSIQFF